MDKYTIAWNNIPEKKKYVATLERKTGWLHSVNSAEGETAAEAIGKLFISNGKLEIDTFYLGKIWTDRDIAIYFSGPVETEDLDEMFFVSCADPASPLWSKEAYRSDAQWLKGMEFLAKSKYSTDQIAHCARLNIDRYKCEIAEAKLEIQGVLDPYQYEYEHGKRDGYVYILSGGGYYKIGLSKDPKQRIGSFAPKLPFKTEIVHTIKTNDMYALEKELHKKYADKRTNGEWFKLDEKDIDEIRAMKTEKTE